MVIYERITMTLDPVNEREAIEIIRAENNKTKVFTEEFTTGGVSFVKNEIYYADVEIADGEINLNAKGVYDV